MQHKVDQCPVTRKQKLKLYKLGICPTLTWPLTINEFPISWVERVLEATTTRYLKRWAGLTKSTNPSVLYLPRSSGGLGLTSVVSHHKTLQVSRQAQLLTSTDSTVRRLAEKNLQAEVHVMRKNSEPQLLFVTP